jgi:hypothetical protein
MCAFIFSFFEILEIYCLKTMSTGSTSKGPAAVTVRDLATVIKASTYTN